MLLFFSIVNAINIYDTNSHISDNKKVIEGKFPV